MTKIRINSVAIALCFWAGMAYVHAQEKKQLTLDEAVKMGIQHSKNLQIDVANIEAATADLLAAKNKRLPDLKLSGSYMRFADATVNLKFGGGSGNGGMPIPKSAVLGQANFAMPLFEGGKIRYGVKSAKYLIEAAKLSKENDKVAIAYNVAQAYNNLFKASQAIKVLEENLMAAEQRDTTFFELENHGIIARNDRLKANFQTSNMELQLLEAKNNYSIASINMDLLLGLPETTELEVDPNYTNEMQEMNVVSYYLGEALQNRKDLLALEERKKAATFSTKEARAENYPTLTLTGGYIAADVPNFITAYNIANAGLGLSYNVANLWKRNSALKQSRAREMQLEASSQLLNDEIKLEVNRDYQNATYAQKRIAVFEKSALQANENYRITKNKFDNGLATMTELLDADATQISANVGVINAKADAALAYRKLVQTTGILIIK